MAQIAHHVYFLLNDRSEEKVQGMLAECKKYLDNHDGLVSFGVGVREPELNREVNQDFDVSLHCVFADRPAHDAYQVAERHLKFIEENKAGWAEVRVFDSILE
jgi:adenosylmethionine-8-amino-7-oxononanoate aminotransferase